jgi:hypothetical protein
MEDITFTIRDTLFDNSLIRPLMRGLWGEMTLRFDPEDHQYHSVNHSINFVIKITYYYNSIIAKSFLEMMFSEYKSKYECNGSLFTNSELCMMLFERCLLKMERDYRYSKILDHEVRKYPIYQLLENRFALTGYDDHRYYVEEANKPWKGFVLLDTEDTDPSGEITIEKDGEILLVINVVDKNIPILMDEIKAGTADPILYELPIERMKSARKTE